MMYKQSKNGYVQDHTKKKLKTLQDLEKPLKKIGTTLKPMVPFKAEMPTETIIPPEVGDQADCNEVNTLHIDEFLYDVKDVEKLIKKGKIKKYYCKDCGSRNSEELIVTSHSMSRKALQYIFKVLLPADLKGKQLLDVGSRLGAVLYGAYYCSNAAKIIGVEINKELCDIQDKIIKQFSMDKNRILVEHSDVTNVENLIKTTDILVVNVLDFFVDIQKHIEIWRFLRKHLKKGAHLVANRSMVDTFNCLDIFEEFIDWLTICKPYQIDNEMLFDVEEYSEIYLYTIM
ncbi:uncharacterized protein LOC121734675 isoform X2 [Aricia agestis]|uniref:uncharacterized protein LOC121734675 isoform X2 n=1 Tax=Aricia agestis TaxID=91739 RepID=UPI001C205FC9|nr:uncharacterized protein LOC121734675 isoform X2 [Aricia agestis]